MAMEVIVPPAVPPLEPVTTRVAVEVADPLKAAALAVMVVVPAPIAVARPVELTVAMAGAEETQVTPLVTGDVVVRLALPNVPIAVNCAV